MNQTSVPLGIPQRFSLFGFCSRWRTLHEVTVVSLILHDGDDRLARRYLDHEVVDSKKALDRFLIDHEALGFRQPSTREVESSNRAYKKMLDKHGPSFRHEYGWAAEALSMERPRFIDLQVAAGKSAMHSHYKMASYSVHATAKALSFRVSNLYDDGVVTAGASNAGIDEAGVKLATSLALITYVLPAGKFRIDKSINLLAVADLRDRAITFLAAADRALRNDDRVVRRALKEYDTE